LLGDEDGVRGTHGAGDDADLASADLGGPQLGVVAGPVVVTLGVASTGQVPDDVAIWIEQAHRRHRAGAESSLSSCFADDLPTQSGFSGGTAQVLMMITDVDRNEVWVLVHGCSLGWWPKRPMVWEIVVAKSRGPRRRCRRAERATKQASR